MTVSWGESSSMLVSWMLTVVLSDSDDGVDSTGGESIFILLAFRWYIERFVASKE
jgi:hypothetical protein